MNLFELSAKISADTRDYEKAVKNATKVSKSLKDIMERSATQSETNKNKIKVLASEYSSAKAKVATLTTAFNKAAKEEGITAERTKQLAKELQEAEKESNDLKGQLDELTKKSKKAGDGFSKLGSALGKGLKTAGKIGVAAVGAAAAGITALTTAAVNNYAEYEQLVGGVETLFGNSSKTLEGYVEDFSKKSEEEIMAFQKQAGIAVDGIIGPQTMAALEKSFATMGDASEKVIENAANAYKTAGLSANQYMETVTSFSASLISSLGGDTEAAAKYADMAITDMSDNANKMGTSMEMIQNAYQGFAKQNYTMLDNLKLGYGGTKGEMERLLKDADALSESFNLQTNEAGELVYTYADIVDAIHIVQDEMDITGTTALEAGRTISGSVGAMKAAWTNLVTGFADGNADIGKLIDNLVTTIVGDGTENNLGVLGNILPAVERALNGVVSLIQGVAPKIIDILPGLIESLVPTLISSAINLVDALIDVLPGMVETVLDAVLDNAPEILETFAELSLAIIGAIAKYFPKLVDKALDLADDILETLGDVDWAEVGEDIVYGLWYGIQSLATWLWNKVSGWIGGIWDGICDFFGIASPSKEMKWVGQMLVDGLAESLDKNGKDAVSAAESMSADVLDALSLGNVEIGASVHRGGAYGGVGSAVGNSFGDVIINIDGAKYSDEQSLASAIALEIQSMTDRRVAVYA